MNAFVILDRAAESHTSHYFRVREMTARPAELPDDFIMLFFVRFEKTH